jgi:hypothetical protein
MKNPVEEFLELAEEPKTKEADGFLSNLWNAFKGGFGGGGGPQGQTTLQALAHGAGSYLPGALLTGSLGAAFAGAAKGVGAIRERFAKARDFQQMIEANPMLDKHDAGHVQMLYNSLRSMSPNMAKDPLIAGSFVRQMLSMSPESGPAVPMDTAKLLSETSRNLSQTKGSHPFLEAMRLEPLKGGEPSHPLLRGETKYGPNDEVLGRTEKHYDK